MIVDIVVGRLIVDTNTWNITGGHISCEGLFEDLVCKKKPGSAGTGIKVNLSHQNLTIKSKPI